VKNVEAAIGENNFLTRALELSGFHGNSLDGRDHSISQS
jgi:hypothetical protein